MITIQNQAKTMTKHISCDFKCKFNSTTCNSNKKWNNKKCQRECKNYRKCKKDYNWNPSTCISVNSDYLKSIDDTSVVACDEIISVVDTVSTKMTDTIATNVMSTASINYQSKKVRDCYYFISDHISIDNCYYLISLCKRQTQTEKHIAMPKI